MPRAASSSTLIRMLSALLSAGAACGPPMETRGVDIETSAVSGPACATHDVRVVDLEGDLRDIWAGRETPDSGKQADPGGQVVVDFSTTLLMPSRFWNCRPPSQTTPSSSPTSAGHRSPICRRRPRTPATT